MKRRLIKIIADVLNKDENEIKETTKQSDVDNWDSLNSLLLINEIEKEFNVKFSIDEVIDIIDVFMIKKLLIQKGIKSTDI